MPDETSKELNKILTDILFWPRYNLPTPPQLLALEHLAKEGEPRLYLRGYVNGFLRGGVSNSVSDAGWDLLCDVQVFFNHWFGSPLAWWVERDDERSADKKKEYAVYKISRVGRRVIEWSHSHGRYGAKTPSSPYALSKQQEE